MLEIKHNPELCSIRMENFEDKIKDLSKKFDTFDSIKEVLIELKILTAQQIEANAQRDEMLKEHGIALAKAVEALKELGKKQDKHEEKLESLDFKFSESEKQGIITTSELIKYGVVGVLSVVGTALMSGIIK